MIKTTKRVANEEECTVELMTAMMEDENAMCIESREILINGEINHTAIERYVMPIIEINKIDDDNNIPIEERQPILLYINSVGGDVANGFALVDTIKASKTPIIGVVFSYAYSMGIPILLACHKRYCYKHASFLIHDGAVGLENSVGKVKDYYKYLIVQEKQMKNYIVANTKISKRMLERNWRTEWYFDSNKAVELGVVDKIIDNIV